MPVRTLARALLIFALTAAAICAPLPATAQVTRADSAAVLLAAAVDFENRGEHDVAEALYRHIRARFPGTPAAQSVLGRLEASTTVQSRAGGETELTVWSTLYGIWLGMAVPAAMDADGPEPYGVGLLLGAPGGFFGGRALARSRPLSLGQTRAITWGGTWGAWQGMGWAHALDLGGGERLYDDIVEHEQQSPQAVFASMIAGSAVGILGGTLAARREIMPGTSTSAMLGSMWGAWFGFASSILADLDEDPTWATTMLAGNAGLVGGAVAGSRWRLTRSRARLISVGGLIGAVGGLGVVLISQPGDDNSEIGIPMAGSIIGLAVGGFLTRGSTGEEDASENAAAALPMPGALVNWSGGAFSLSAPLPAPVRDYALRTQGPGGLAWKVPLLNVRF